MLKIHTRHVIYITAGVLILSILYALKNTSYFVRASGFIFSALLFFLFDYFFGLGFKKHHYFIFIFISATGILLSPLYFISSNYDKALHLIFPFLLCILIFFMANKLNTKFSIKLLIATMIVISLLALFEIGEYSLDKLFDWKLQGVYLRDYSGVEKLKIIMDKNDDTMIDLILGTISSLFFAITKTGIFHYKKYVLKQKI
ncbi:MAG: hypothetical protein Q8N63_06210 [Nanoarchaeota archaeon]|nr:hypothetical protein [Nanoarchaeota archaeon]